VDFQLFSAPIGTPESGFAEFLQTALAILPEPNHRLHPQLGVGPGDPHAGPYTQELAQGLQAAGFVNKTVFEVSEFTAPNAIIVAWMNVPGPGAPTGSSPDYESGPIISNGVFPMRFTGDVYLNGALFEQDAFGLEQQAPTGLTPPIDVQGYSHFPYFAAENSAFAPPGLTDLTGSYEYRWQVRDAGGNGWDISARFQVIPEPGTMTLLGTGTLVLLGCGWRRRRRAA
jgi:hypothetical protein